MALTKVDGEGVGTLDSLNITESNNGATEGPSFELHRNSASPADNDVLGALLYTGKSSTGADKTYSSMNGFISNVANANASGGLIFNTRNSDTLAERMTLDASGNLLVGTGGSQPSSSVAGWRLCNPTLNAPSVSTGSGTGAVSALTFQNGNGVVGQIYTSGSSTSYVTSSDYRLKENVDYTWDATTRLKQLKPARFNFIADADTTVDGFLAHEAQAVVPECVTGTKDEVDDDGNPIYQGIDQSKLVPLLVKTIQELEARIAALETA